MDEIRPMTAVYPGTFDPLTMGHVSLVSRGLEVFDKIILAVAVQTPKAPLFTIGERLDMAREVFAGDTRVEVDSFDGLLVQYAARRGVRAILRGLRAVSDFEFEFQLALMNRRLERHVQTVFLMTDYRWLYISSTIIKQAASLGGNIRGLVPEAVVPYLYAKYATRAEPEA